MQQRRSKGKENEKIETNDGHNAGPWEMGVRLVWACVIVFILYPVL